jgi:hypothetical protein
MCICLCMLLVVPYCITAATRLTTHLQSNNNNNNNNARQITTDSLYLPFCAFTQKMDALSYCETSFQFHSPTRRHRAYSTLRLAEAFAVYCILMSGHSAKFLDERHTAATSPALVSATYGPICLLSGER